MIANKTTHIFCKFFTKSFSGGFLDKNNILWKWIDGNFVGKRSVCTFDRRACWLSDTEPNNVKSYWCGNGADYDEIFESK